LSKKEGREEARDLDRQKGNCEIKSPSVKVLGDVDSDKLTDFLAFAIDMFSVLRSE